MCVMSIVHDHYRDQFPGGLGGAWPPIIPNPYQLPAPTAEEQERLRQLIKDFREAQEAAAKLDKMMKQPDCVDPEKAKLQERVAELEKQLAAIREAAKP